MSRLMECIDTIVIGDGEYATVEAIESDVTLVNAEQNRKLFLGKNYDDVAIPDRKYLDLNSYEYYIDGARATNIISQMGCPYQCEFCSGRGSKTFSMVRRRSVGNILNEIDMLYKRYDYRGFMFYDDELNISNKHFEELLIALINYQRQNNISFNLRGFTRSDLLTDGQAKLMYEAGFRWLLVGFESGSDKILANVNKGCTVADNTRCFEIARKNKLKVKALMSIGHAGESHGTINDTIKWLGDMRPDETDVTIIAVYPGSNYFNRANRITDDWFKYIRQSTNDALYFKDIDFLKESNFYKSKSNEYVSYISTDYLSCEDIVQQRLLIEKSLK